MSNLMVGNEEWWIMKYEWEITDLKDQRKSCIMIALEN